MSMNVRSVYMAHIMNENAIHTGLTLVYCCSLSDQRLH